MSIKVLLIQPPLWPHELYTRGSRATASLLPPLGLAYLAAFLEEQGHHVEIMDGIVAPVALDELARRAQGFDLVGITVISSYVVRVIEVIEALKRSEVRAPIVVGGPHVTALPDALLRAGADFGVIGEGELTLAELAEHVEGRRPDLAGIRGLVYLDQNREKVFTGPRTRVRPMDLIPLPARHLLPMERYQCSVARSSRQPSHSMMASRGCRGRCTFCSHRTFGLETRYFSVKRIVDEIFLLRDRYGAQDVAVWDDDFLADPEIAARVCEGLEAGRFDLPWSASACVENVTLPLLLRMKQAGLGYIAYGVESGSQRVLHQVKKNLTKERIREVVGWTKELSIPVRAYFILGFPGETVEEMKETVEFAKELDVELASFTLFIPLPGTVEYERAKKTKGFDPEYFLKVLVPEINFPERPLFVPEGMTETELLTIHRNAYSSYYLRPSMILRRLKGCLSNPHEVIALYRGARTLLANMLWPVSRA